MAIHWKVVVTIQVSIIWITARCRHPTIDPQTMFENVRRWTSPSARINVCNDVFNLYRCIHRNRLTLKLWINSLSRQNASKWLVCRNSNVHNPSAVGSNCFVQVHTNRFIFTIMWAIYLKWLAFSQIPINVSLDYSWAKWSLNEAAMEFLSSIWLLGIAKL